MPQKPVNTEQTAKLPAEPETTTPSYVAAEYGATNPTIQHVQMAPVQQQDPLQPMMPLVQQPMQVQQSMGLNPMLASMQQPMTVASMQPQTVVNQTTVVNQAPANNPIPQAIQTPERIQPTPPTIVIERERPVTPIIITDSASKAKRVDEDEDEDEECCNVYWLFFILGFFISVFWICGMTGLCSHRKSEKDAGRANAVAITILFLFVVIAAVSDS